MIRHEAMWYDARCPAMAGRHKIGNSMKQSEMKQCYTVHEAG
jgi:hypothetical protein